MKKTFLIAIGVMALLIATLFYTCNKAFVMPAQERYELTEDSLSVFLGREIILDSTPHVLVSISNVLAEEYTTDKGITVDYKFVSNYFKVRDTMNIDTNIIPTVDGTRVETKNGNE